jgi:UMP-CMP kinase
MSFPRIIFVLGGPGSGKGTQCQKLCERYPVFVHLSAGELLRDARTSGSALGEMIQKCMMEGSIVPAEVTVGLLKEAMQRSGWAERRFLIDGFPRNDDNYNTWFRLMPDVTVEHCLFLNCDDVSYRQGVMISRIMNRAEGRSDDNLETVTKRLQTYRNSTEPIIRRFEGEGKLVAVQAEGEVEEIFARVQTGLGLV